MHDDLEWFWNTDRVVTVLHVAGGRGAAIHQLITYSPEVPKWKSVEVHNGAAHINQEGLGYEDPSDLKRHFHMHVAWDGSDKGEWPASAMKGRTLEQLRHQISRLRTRFGEPLPSVIARGGVLTYRCYPGLDDGGLVWPNRRIVAVYHDNIGHSLREWYQKGLAVPMADWQAAHLDSLGKPHHNGTVLDYYTMAHGGLSPDHRGNKAYMAECLPLMAGNQRSLLARDGIHRINIREFFSDGWMAAYGSLCRFCGITRNDMMAARFMHKYRNQQWRRDAA